MENHKFICCVIFCLFTSTIASHDDVSLDVSCEDSGISVKIIFKRPFEGVVYSKEFYEDPICVYVPAWSGTYKMTTFLVPSTKCGTHVWLSGGSRSMVNTIVVQQNPLLETSLDSAHNISCDHKVFNERIISSSALHVSGKSAESFHFSDEGIETWMDIKIGTDRFSNTQADSAEVGDPLTVVIYANDGGRDYGLRVKNCIAHDTIIDENSTVYQLSDTSGCALQPDLLSEFSVTRQTKGLSNIMAYARMNAFRFTGKDSLQLTCAVQFCKNDCPMFCLSSHVGSNNFDRVKSVEKRSVAEDTYDQSNLESQSRQRLMKYTIKELAKRLMNRRRLPKLPEVEPNVGRRLLDEEIEQSSGDGLITQNEHQNKLIDTNFVEQDASPFTISSVEDPDLSNLVTTNIIDQDMSTMATMDIQTFNTEELTTFKTLKFLRRGYNELSTELVTVSPTISTEDLGSYTTPDENESNSIYIYNVTKTFFINTHADKSELGSEISDVNLNFSDPYCFPKFRFTLVVGLLSFFLLCLILVILVMSLYMKREKKKHRIDSFLLYNFQ